MQVLNWICPPVSSCNQSAPLTITSDDKPSKLASDGIWYTLMQVTKYRHLSDTMSDG